MKSGAFVISWRRDDGKKYAFTEWYNEGSNLVNMYQTYKARWKVESINLCASKKEALEIADAWNDGWRRSGEYANPFFVEYRREA